MHPFVEGIAFRLVKCAEDLLHAEHRLRAKYRLELALAQGGEGSVAGNGTHPRWKRFIAPQRGEVAETVDKCFLAHVLCQGVVVDDAADIGQQHVLVLAHQDP